jgi:uroporphyrinogen-III synthase
MSGLMGKRVVITRAQRQATELTDALTRYGATALLYPCLAILPPEDLGPLDAALRSLAHFDWLVLTSANTVGALAERLRALELRLPAGLCIGAVGTSTAQATKAKLGVTVATVPERFSTGALAEALPDVAGMRMLLPQSAAADDTLARALAKRGASVSGVIAYRVGVGTGGVDLPRLLAARAVDAITLASGSALTNLMARLERDGGDVAQLAAISVACIGDNTAATARQRGLRVDVTAAPQTVAGLCAALDRYYRTATNEEVQS